MKTLALPLVALLGAAAPVSAQTYANMEANSGWSGSEYAGTVIDAHVGYKKDNWYVQGGPSRVSNNSGDSDIEFSGKAGASFVLSEKMTGYGEVSFMTGQDDTGYATKLGFTYDF